MLVLDISEEGHNSPQLIAQIEKQLARNGHPVQTSALLRSEQRALRDQRALIELARQTQSRLLVWGDVQTSGDRKKLMQLQLFDAASPGDSVPEFDVCRQEQLRVALACGQATILVKIGTLVGTTSLLVYTPPVWQKPAVKTYDPVGKKQQALQVFVSKTC